MNIFVTVLTLTAIFASTEAGPQGRITHGHVAGEREFPFYVGIIDNGSLVCGGAIISNNWVITAAHCMENRTAVDLLIGSTNAYYAELELTIFENDIIRHPDFNYTTRNNDIALIKTPDIEYTSKINQVLLPTMRDESDLAGLLVTAVGWGLDHNSQLDLNLKYTIMRAMSREECEPHLIINSTIRTSSEITLCAMTYMGSPCFGDSGGPVIIAGIIVGVISFGAHENCSRTNPVGMARVTEYRDWIKNVSGVYRP